MSDFDYDLFVIGAGSGGVRAARISASHGAKVAVAEEYRVGGTCVIRGCVPKKMLVYASHFAEDLAEAHNYGWDVEGAKLNWPRLRDRVADDVSRLEGLFTETLNNNDVDIYPQRAEISGPNSVKLADGKEVTAKYILIATGGWPSIQDIPGAEHGITSNEIFHLDALPEHAMISGGGYIANEFAGILTELGVQVTLLVRGDKMLRTYDQEIVDKLLDISKSKGIDIRFNTSAKAIRKDGDGSLSIDLENSEGGAETVKTGLFMFATGRHPKTSGLGLKNAGVDIDKAGAVIVDEYNRSNVGSIYAVGDVTNRVQLTPVAIREGHAFADTVFGDNPRRINYGHIPSAVFSNPPIGSVGMTEEEAQRTLGKVDVYRSDFRAMKNVLSGNLARGLYKMVVDGETNKVVGIHMLSPEAPEILQAAAVAVKAGLTKQDFDDTVALHPSMAEELVLLK